MRSFAIALRLLRQDIASGELRLLGLALVIAVAATTAVSFFTDRVRQALEQQGASLIAADLAMEHGEPLPDALVTEAQRRGLQTGRWISFPSVIFNGERPVLVQVKGVDETYPLRGELRIQPDRDAVPQARRGPPEAGSIWVESRLLPLLGRKVGDPVPLGQLSLRIAGIIDQEPDRGGNLFQFAPRVMLDAAALADSGLLGPASRVKHRLLVAGDPEQIADYRRWVKARLPQGASLYDINNARPELRSALERGGRFLNLAALTASLLAGAALAISSRGFIQRQSDAAALMRSFGAGSGLVLRIFVWRLLLLTVSASLLGGLLGMLAQLGLTSLVGSWFSDALPPPGPRGWLVGLALGMGLMLGFALPPLVGLSRIPPLRVLRRDLTVRRGRPLSWLLAAATLAALVAWQAGDAALAGRLLGGLAAAMLIFYGAARILLWLAGRWLPRLGGSWRAGAAALTRHAGMTTLQLAAFGLAITVLLVLAIVRGDLLDTWQRTLPPETPDHFLINIQPHEVEPLAAMLTRHGIDHAGVFPMIRGRLTAVNGEPVAPEAFDSPRARRLAAREFNLSLGAELQADNRVVAGRWWGEAGREGDGLSVEQGLADTLGIRLGDRLQFDIAGSIVQGEVTSLRSVRWDSFNVNFFVIGTPGLLADQPATYISSFHLGGRDAVLRELAEGFPGVSVLDVKALLDQVRRVIGRGAQAVQAVFAFTLLTALVLMLAAMQTQRAQRARETGLLRTLGAGSRQLLGASAVEFVGLGLLAGLLGSAMASLIGWLLARQVFELAWLPDWRLWAMGLAAGGLAAGITGLAVSRNMLDASPRALLNQRLD
jgi:putative ABC transport system permease protein